MQEASEQRALARLPCLIAVSEQRRSASVGQIQDLSLDGMFVQTPTPLAEGTVLPAAFQLGKDGPEIRPEAEVVRRTPAGMGMRFLNMSRQDSRRLRRYIGEMSNLVGRRNVAVERLQDVDGRMTAPISDGPRILQLLADGSKTASFVAIPEQRIIRETASLAHVGTDRLDFACKSLCELRAGESIFVLYTHEFVSYSFPATVLRVDGPRFSTSVPTVLHYSERRSAQRQRPDGAGELEVPLPWRNHERMTWPIVDTSSTGVSFRAKPDEVYFWPGTTIPQATLRQAGTETVVERSVVKHLTALTDSDGKHWVKVGLAFEVSRETPSARAEELLLQQPAGPFSKVTAWGRDVAAKATYLYHSRIKRLQASQDAPFQVVRFPNRAGKPVVGLVNRSFEDKGRVRCPLVIVTPGFGARKETVCALALTLVDNFRRNHRDVAVLRFDGTNNLGESYKDPGCEGEGRNCLNYTVSGGLDDLLGALAWSRSNPYVDPTDIIVVSVSFSSVAARRALTMPESSAVSRWICFMGAPDAQNAVMNVAGSADGYGMYISGKKVGHVSLLGCLVDCDNICRDMKELGVATLEDARRDMTAIRADVTWFVGKHDAFMDPRRVTDIMSVKAPGKREVIEVNAGHVPQTSDEALSEFGVMTRHIWRHLYGRDLAAVVPSRGWVAAVSEREWQRVRSQVPQDLQQYWRDYLVGEGGLGFDVWSLTPEYRQLMIDQARLAEPKGKQMIDLGAGTGNTSLAVATLGPKSLTAIDLVPEALARAKVKVQALLPYETVSGSLDGNEVIAMRRFLAGELTSFADVAARLPLSHRGAGEAMAELYNKELHALLRGSQVPVDAALKRAVLPASHLPAAKDIVLLARVARGAISPEEALATASKSFHESLRKPGRLPFADQQFDGATCSLVMSYLQHYEDFLSEVTRILKPGSIFVISSMVPDADISKTFMDSIAAAETLNEEDIPSGYTRETLKQALRKIVDNGSNLHRLEEEGTFSFWNGEELANIMVRAGFHNPQIVYSSGQPPQSVIVRCIRP